MTLPTNSYEIRFNWTVTAGIGIYSTKAWLSPLVNFKNAIWTLEGLYAIKFCFKFEKKCHAMKGGSTAKTQRPRDRIPRGSIQALPDPRRPDRANPTHKLLMIPFFDSTGIGLHAQSVRNTMLRFLREFRKIFHRKRPALFKSGSVAFPQGQCKQTTTPSLSQTISPRWASRRFLTVPIVQTLLPVTFGYSLSSEAVVMRQPEEMKEAVTKIIDTFTQEDFNGAFQKLLE